MTNIPKHSFSCGELECDICYYASFAGHSDKQKLGSWDYKNNPYEPINYLINDNREVFFKCVQCKVSFKMQISLATCNDILCSDCSRKEIYKNHKCEKCDYETNNKTNFKIHILNYHCTKAERKKDYPFFCEECNTGRLTKKEFDKHLRTSTHKRKKMNNE